MKRRATYKVLSVGDEHVHLGRLCRDNGGVKGVLAQVHLTPVRLLYGNRGNGAQDLHLNGLAVDELARADDVIEDDSGLLAPVQDDVVTLPVDTDGRSLAAERVHGLVHFNLINHNVGIVSEKR